MFILNRWVNAMAFRRYSKASITGRLDGMYFLWCFIIVARHQVLTCAFWLWFNGHLGTKIYYMLVFLLSLYQFSVMCFPLSDLCFPSKGKWWMHWEVGWVKQCNIIICQHHLQFHHVFSFIQNCQQYKESILVSVDDQPSIYQSCRCCDKNCRQTPFLLVITVQDVYLQMCLI